MSDYNKIYNNCIRYGRNPVPDSSINKQLHGTETLNFLQKLNTEHPTTIVSIGARNLLKTAEAAHADHLHEVLTKNDPKLLNYIQPEKLYHYLFSTPKDQRTPEEIDKNFFKDFDPNSIDNSAGDNDYRPTETIPEDFYS